MNNLLAAVVAGDTALLFNSTFSVSVVLAARVASFTLAVTAPIFVQSGALNGGAISGHSRQIGKFQLDGGVSSQIVELQGTGGGDCVKGNRCSADDRCGLTVPATLMVSVVSLMVAGS